MLERWKSSVTNFISIKILMALIVPLFAVPILGILYWGFDSSYLATFGVGPEIYSRPFFASRLMNTWLVLTLLYPFLGLITIICLILFGLLIYKNYKTQSQDKSNSTGEGCESKTIKFIDAIEKSVTQPLALWLLCFLLILMSLSLMTHVGKKAREIANKQIEAYTQHGICGDAFEDSNLGCYRVPGVIESAENLVVLNNKEVVIYMNYKDFPVDVVEAENTQHERKFYINVFDKESKMIISREVVRRFKGVKVDQP